MNTVPRNDIFGENSGPHTIIVARGGKVRHWTLQPWLLRTGTALATLTLVAFAGTTALFLTSDQIAAALKARETRTVEAYEKRIASLRAQLDSITSRQHVDRAAVTSQVELLLGQQEELAARYTKLEPLLEKARSSGLIEADAPIPTGRPASPADASAPGADATDADGSRPEAPDGDLVSIDPDALDIRRSLEEFRALPLDHLEYASIADELIPMIGRSMDYVEERQVAQLEALAENAHRKATLIADLLGSEGIELPTDSAETGVGGPFVPLPEGRSFEDNLNQVGETLAVLDRLSSTAKRLPLGIPVEDAVKSSAFGIRLDPFFGRKALHTGIDYAARSGTPIHATAGGKIVHAEANGTYGLMVEIDHGNGWASRYGHMSGLSVRVGDVVAAGDNVGSVGSTGRSTGPHLHYEIRRDGAPIDPDGFLRAGEKLRAL